MAQNYRDGEGRMVESHRKLSGSNYTSAGFQDRKNSLQERVCEPADTMPTKERNTDYPGTESKVYFGVENPGGGTVGTIGVEKLGSGAGPKVYVEDRSAEWGRDPRKAEDAPMKATAQDVGVGARATDNLQQQSRYVQHDSTLDYNDQRGYGGEVYEPKQVQEPAVAVCEVKSERMHEASHKPLTVDVDEQHQPQAVEAPKSPGFVERIKEILSGKPQNDIAEPQQEATADGDDKHKTGPPKKGVLEKIKEKVSPSP